MTGRRAQITPQTASVITLMLTGDEWYGLDICRKTGLNRGTTYEILNRLEQDGWLCSRMSRGNGGYRKMYRFTTSGRKAASDALTVRPDRVTYDTLAALRAERDEKRDERDHWIRLFHRLDAAVSHHKRDTGELNIEIDDALYAARERILRDAGPRS